MEQLLNRAVLATLGFFFHSFASAEKVKQVGGFGEGMVKLALTLIKHWALL